MVLVPVPTFEKFRFRFQLHIKTKKANLKKMPFYIVSCFIRKKFINFNKFSSGSGTEINYGSFPVPSF